MNNLTEDKHSVCIAMVAPIGVNLKYVEDNFREQIESLNIKSKINPIKITELEIFNPANKLNGYDKYNKLMDLGDKAREKKGKDTLAKEIYKKIENNKISIIHQLKTPQECYYLKTSILKNKNIPVFIVSVFDTLENRIKFLNRKIKDNPNTLKLIERDEKDQENEYGQNVSNAFTMGDFFIDASQKSNISTQVKRIINAIYCYPHISPTIDEYGMYLAEAASLKSRDLSRQVGACILNNSGSVLALGYNEAPKALGGCYWENDTPDNRDFIYGIDSSYKYRNEIIIEFLSAISKINEETKELIKVQSEELLKVQSDTVNITKLINDNKNLFKGTRVMNLIEFGRSVHAEVGAISEAARNGISLKNGILYTTVFPCHLCARYIISSGIKEIIFIEPYPKSLTLDLYSSEVELSQSYNGNNKIAMRPFIGVSPRIYRNVFIYDEQISGSKKNHDATLVNWQPNLKKWIT